MKKKILIIDDDIVTLRILKTYLEGRYEVQIENAGYRFVERMEEYEADMILLDIEMPVLNGLQVFEAFMKEPKHKNIPVVFLSGISNPSIVREVMEQGAAGYFIKTAPRAELLRRVEQTFIEYKNRRGGEEILIVADDISLLRRMRTDLESASYKVQLVTSAIQALEILRKKHVDLLILGSDALGTSPQQILTQLRQTLSIEQFPVLLMERPYEKTELLEKVGETIDR